MFIHLQIIKLQSHVFVPKESAEARKFKRLKHLAQIKMLTTCYLFLPVQWKIKVFQEAEPDQQLSLLNCKQLVFLYPNASLQRSFHLRRFQNLHCHPQRLSNIRFGHFFLKKKMLFRIFLYILISIYVHILWKVLENGQSNLQTFFTEIPQHIFSLIEHYLN